MATPRGPYAWDARSGRYRGANGRYVSSASVRDALDKSIDASGRAMRAITEQLRAGGVSLADWQLQMMAEIRSSHLAAAALAKGGWAQMSQADYGRAGAAIRKQYDYLRNMAAEIASGKQRLDGSLLRRAEMYPQASRGFYHEQAAREAAKRGQTRIRSIRHSRDSCADCVRLNGVWFEMGDPAYIPIGRRICLVHCRCSEEYATEEEARIAA